MPILLKKPRKWVFSPALVTPRWSWFWKGVDVAFPFWEGAGLEIFGSFGKSAITTHGIGASGWHHSSVGGIWRTIDVSAIDFFTVQNHKGISGAASRAIIVYANTTISEIGSNYIVGWGPDTAGNAYRFAFNDGNLRTEASSGFVQGSTSVNDGEWHLFLSVFEGSNITDVVHYVDAAVDSTGSSSAVALDTTADDIKLFARPDNDSLSLRDTDVAYVAVLNFAPTRTQIKQLSHDPFGPFRMVDEVGDGIITTAPVGPVGTDSLIPILKRRRR